MDRLLDKEVYQLYKVFSFVNYLGVKIFLFYVSSIVSGNVGILFNFQVCGGVVELFGFFRVGSSVVSGGVSVQFVVFIVSDVNLVFNRIVVGVRLKIIYFFRYNRYVSIFVVFVT